MTLQDAHATSNSSAGQDGQTDLVTRTGLHFHVRRAHPGDEAALAAFFEHVTPDDLRFRFLTAANRIRPDQLNALTHVDHERCESFLAFLPGDDAIIASAMLAGDAGLDSAEVAISIREDLKGRGLGWTLLEHVSHYAKGLGFKRIQSIESHENHAAIELEREMGFTVRPMPGDATLVIVEAVLGA